MNNKWRVIMEVEVEADGAHGAIAQAVDTRREDWYKKVIAVLRGPKVDEVRTDPITGRTI